MNSLDEYLLSIVKLDEATMNKNVAARKFTIDMEHKTNYINNNGIALNENCFFEYKLNETTDMLDLFYTENGFDYYSYSVVFKAAVIEINDVYEQLKLKEKLSKELEEKKENNRKTKI